MHLCPSLLNTTAYSQLIPNIYISFSRFNLLFPRSALGGDGDQQNVDIDEKKNKKNLGTYEADFCRRTVLENSM